MKGQQFTFEQVNFEVYNVTENMIHCVKLNSKMERCSPNAKTLKNFRADFFQASQTIGLIVAR